MNQLHFGDNLTVLRNHVKDETVDLIYLDPPFNSSATYNVLFKQGDGIASEAQAEAFKDTWAWGHAAAEAYEDALRMGGDLPILLRSLRSWLGDNGLMAYLAMMSVRLIELHRVLKPSGSLYLHCDPTGSHYLKLLLDTVFGTENFRNEIIWKRTSGHSSARRWGPVHDDILFYGKSDRIVWNPVFQAHDAQHLASKYSTSDDHGPFMPADLTGAGKRTGDSGKPWRGFDPDKLGRHWAVPRNVPKDRLDLDGWEALTSQEKLDRLDLAKLIYWPKKEGGFPRFKRYVNEGVPIQSVISDIPPINSQAQERLGYPTQKPIALLERIIAASSKDGAVVLDPFCGCGTTIEAAETLNRQWIGIDVTHYAVTLIETRLRKAHPKAQYKIFGRPTDLAGARDLADRDKYQFQWWAAWQLGAQTYETKKGADRGIDGNIFYANGPYGHGRIIISVKGGENVSPVMVRELSGVIQREDAEMGILITLAEPTRAMIADAAGAGFVQKSAHGRLPRVQIVTVADLLDGRRPKLPPLPVVQDGPRAKARKRDKDQLELVLPFSGSGGLRTEDGVMIDPRFLALG
jgi:adenine specific DNA methylase Mod